MPTDPLHVLRVNARELLRVPGTSRTIEVSVAARELGLVDDRIAGPLEVALGVTSTIDGVVASGTVTVPWSSACRRCLADVGGVAVVELAELYQDDVSDDDAFPIEGDRIDLVPAVRENVLLELPDDPLCRPECAGICPVCGIDRNEASCDCDTAVRDERWAALDQLRLDE